ncbi:hypothetical protein [Sphingomonas endophytica]|uniref:DUF429 domain-containing protein n=1 Tax=Sphingomonas endophytica TaxID=869719 RepID=A0A147I7U5_9SPHN|nr:hypothetical protein [Sphingomonas endophytica]KTT75039.1 hypothetical protein NS334_04145 [Sphingomonas endophytica]
MAPAPDRFTRFVAIDWSGAKGSRHKGIAVAGCDAGTAAPELVTPPGGVWSRTAVLDWILARRDTPTLIGFDFSFSAPFVARGAHLPGETDTRDARALWAYVDRHCDDADLGASSFLQARRGRHFYLGAADGTKRDFLHWRVCEQADGTTKPSTVYDAIGAAQVAKASFAGMRLLHHLGGRIPVWPFDPPPDAGALIVEIYTAIAARATGVPRGRSKLRDAAALDAALAALGSAPHAPLATYSDHATDALMSAAWLRKYADRPHLWHPAALSAAVAATEGWTFGVT